MAPTMLAQTMLGFGRAFGGEARVTYIGTGGKKEHEFCYTRRTTTLVQVTLSTAAGSSHTRIVCLSFHSITVSYGAVFPSATRHAHCEFL